MTDLIDRLPKAELHVHIEGTFEPELMFDMARKNGVQLAHASVEDLRAAYRFSNLQAFLDIYYVGMGVLQTEEDFQALTEAYFDRAAADTVRHVELFVDPQGHTERGLPISVAMDGVLAGMAAARAKHGITSRLIPNALRHLPEASALAMLDGLEPYLDRIVGVGLDSSEMGHPPDEFARYFARARAMGLRLCCHAGEEGPPDYVRQALEIGVDRIDHGNRAMEDPALVAELAARGIALTVCPLSNLALRGIATMAESPVKRMLEAGLAVTVHSDDPAYFGGYVSANYRAVAEALALTDDDLRQLAANSFAGSFLDEADRATAVAEVNSLR